MHEHCKLVGLRGTSMMRRFSRCISWWNETLARRSATTKLIRASSPYLARGTRMRNASRGDKTVERFFTRLDKYPLQLIAKFVVTRELPGLTCMESGVRCYNRGAAVGEKVYVRTFMAGRKACAPISWAMNSLMYSPAVIKKTGTVD
mmetsp:Transcript_33168/g.83656  ORF Transcript_33168/g.83656 Transcript_33168/m.83656 type:complete len:147 (-) Transcript_33168:696-1136(-)